MITRILAATLMFVGLASAQMPGPPMMGGHMGAGTMGEGPGFHAFAGHRMGPPQFWKNPEVAQKLGISDAQVQKLDQIAFDHRMKMIDMRAALEREELKLQPLMQASTPDENQILAQIDKVATQRAQIEKANIQSMLAERRVLTPEQWKKFQDAVHSRMMHARHGDDGPGENRMYFRREFRRGPGTPKDGPPTAAPEHGTQPQQ